MNTTMEQTRETMAHAVADLRSILASGTLGEASREDVLGFAISVGDMLRQSEAAAIELTGVIEKRSATAERFDVSSDCRSANEVLQRTTGAAPTTVKRWSRLAATIKPARVLSSGEQKPAEFPALREALTTGAIGADGLEAATRPLREIKDRVEPADLAEVDEVLAAMTTTTGAPVMCDTLRELSLRLATDLDITGAEDEEEKSFRGRALRLGVKRNGLVPVSGQLVPDVAGALSVLLDSINNPHGQPAGVKFRPSDESDENADARTMAQRNHDAPGTILAAVPNAPDMPTNGGGAPVLVIHATEDTVRAGEGWATIPGADGTGTDVPVPFAAAKHVGCCGTIQHLTTAPNGNIVKLTIDKRFFSPDQRRAITVRDRSCVIPGCHTPARWCEIHHVKEWSRVGQTDVDNGVLICWHHHRFIDRMRWDIRMNDGVPEVRPPDWIDTTQTWQPTGPRAAGQPKRGA
ncbi:HNH endonuclease signature motif containing protein [Microbacterium gorillae]|uniref:HNH endonuclease signature motif containing protein n=1 Tax=Microbacterium gorillae TaxID=1231063 RepID=UPI000590F420|nr:HNH endonuclease signature motif containing protein [Microbacterium gorillae]